MVGSAECIFVYTPIRALSSNRTRSLEITAKSRLVPILPQSRQGCRYKIAGMAYLLGYTRKVVQLVGASFEAVEAVFDLSQASIGCWFNHGA